MKISRPVIVVGIIVTALGLIFHLQGQAVVGPETSFMYSNFYHRFYLWNENRRASY